MSVDVLPDVFLRVVYPAKNPFLMVEVRHQFTAQFAKKESDHLIAFTVVHSFLELRHESAQFHVFVVQLVYAKPVCFLPERARHCPTPTWLCDRHFPSFSRSEIRSTRTGIARASQSYGARGTLSLTSVNSPDTARKRSLLARVQRECIPERRVFGFDPG
jgi:hypothetical protein